MFLPQVLAGRGDEIKLRLKDRYDWRQAIWRAFPDYPEGTEQPFL